MKTITDVESLADSGISIKTFEGSDLTYVFKVGICLGYIEQLPKPDTRCYVRRLVPSVNDITCDSLQDGIRHIIDGLSQKI